MKRITVLAALAAALPIGALADISGNATLNAGSSFNFDKGTVSAGDITFTGTSITFQGSAKGGVVPGFTGADNYALVTQQLLQQLSPLASNTPIPASSLTPGTIGGVFTNGGNSAKFMVTAISGSSISFQYTTFGASGGGGGGGAPTITKVLNNSSLIPAGFSNSGIAPSSIIQIQGSNLSDAVQGTLGLEDSVKGLQPTLRGASAKITAGGKDYPLVWYYTSPAQSAGVVPAGVPPGQATLTYTYNNQSTSANINIVSAAFGIDVYNGNYAVLQDSLSPTGQVISPTYSAGPNQTLTLWGSGAGKDQGLSDTTANSAQQNITTPIQVFIGNVEVPKSSIRYVGSLYYPGVNGIVFDAPANVPTGCFVSIAVVTNGNVVSNIGVASFASTKGQVCQDSYLGINGTTISSLSGQSNARTGFVSLLQNTGPDPVSGAITTTDSAVAVFQQVSGGSSFSSDASTSISLGSCTLSQTVTSGGTIPKIVGLNAGTVTVTTPDGKITTLSTVPQIAGFYSAQLTPNVIPSTGGVVTFNATGSSDANGVGAFQTSITFPNPILTWTNQAASATVTRGNGQTYTWSGGDPSSFVIMNGDSTSSASGLSASYTCIAPASALSFTVPSYITNTLPAGNGSSSIENSTAFKTFTATGLDFGIAFGAVSYQVNSIFQ